MTRHLLGTGFDGATDNRAAIVHHANSCPDKQRFCCQNTSLSRHAGASPELC